MLWPKKNHIRNLTTKKNSCCSKIMGPHPLKIYLCLVTTAYGCATFAGRVIQYTTPGKWKSSRKNASKFFHVHSLPQSFRTRGNWKNVGTVGTVIFSILWQLPQRLSLIEFNFYDFFFRCSCNQIITLTLKYQLSFILSHFIGFPTKFFISRGDWIFHAM